MGYKGNNVIILVSTPRKNRGSNTADLSDNIYVRTGALIRFHSKRLAKVLEDTNYDFFVRTSDERVIIAVSDSKYQDPVTLSPFPQVSISTTGLTQWISAGEEELVIDRENLSVVDYNADPIDPSPPSSWNYLNRILADINDRVLENSETETSSHTQSETQPKTLFVASRLPDGKNITLNQYVSHMDDHKPRFSPEQFPPNAILVATVILFIVLINNIIEVVNINQVIYYGLVMGSFLLLIGGMIYEDFVRE